MRTLKLMTLFFALTALFLSGCEEKKEDKKGEKTEAQTNEKEGAEEEKKPEAKDDKVAKPEASPNADTKLEPAEWTFDGFKVTGAKPTGWEESPMGSGIIYRGKGGLMSAPMLWISATCEGNCATIAENIKGGAANQVEMHKKGFDSVEILEDGPQPQGHFFELKMKKEGKDAGMIVSYNYKEGWPKTIKCLYQANVPEDLGLTTEMLKLCHGLEITPPAE